MSEAVREGLPSMLSPSGGGGSPYSNGVMCGSDQSLDELLIGSR